MSVVDEVRSIVEQKEKPKRETVAALKKEVQRPLRDLGKAVLELSEAVAPETEGELKPADVRKYTDRMMKHWNQLDQILNV